MVASEDLCGEGEGGRRDRTPTLDALGLILRSLPLVQSCPGSEAAGGTTEGGKKSISVYYTLPFPVHWFQSNKKLSSNAVSYST